MFKELFEYKNNLTVSGLSNALINEYILNFYENNDNDLLIEAKYNCKNDLKVMQPLYIDKYLEGK